MSEVVSKALRVPWHNNPHTLYTHLPATLKSYPPFRPTSIHRIQLVRLPLWTYRPLTHLSTRYPATAGRNCSGRITMRHRGGGVQVRTLTVNYQYSTPEIPKKLLTLEYNRRQSAWLALVYYSNGVLAYHPFVAGLEKGKFIFSNPSPNSIPVLGQWWKLGDVPAGQFVCNVEYKPGFGGQIARAAGTNCRVLVNQPHAEERGMVPVLMPSKEVRLLPKECWCTIGHIGCQDHQFESLGKAGRARNKGRRPAVNGRAMVARDHPHGGGAGVQHKAKRGGRHPGPWSVYRHLCSKFRRTRKRNRASWDDIMRRARDSTKVAPHAMQEWTKKLYVNKNTRENLQGAAPPVQKKKKAKKGKNKD
eukprot:NODE_2238_length_1239_cov_22.493705_g2127_i0.p1 GENE.NODE_2238_length_1239_cov_22.493705_g2127_i0~~NODE_2238_length_1239_cov_22.493705_g2127_i0.p1  ORF type:complete len:361 (-),score=58.99 NODE_2238_length_1239_cov_22.493705_g2127_i0:89-1171(-)